MTDQGILGKVRKLMDRANHPNTPEGERDLCIRRANIMMVKHAIDEALLDQTSTHIKRDPVVVKIHAADRNNALWPKFTTIMQELARTVRVKVAVHFNGDITIVGMPSDVDYFQMMWTSIYLHFVSKMDPKWDNNISFEHNVYNLKSAGRKWMDIRNIAVENNNWVDWPDGGRLIRAYKRHCRIIGETPTNHTQRHNAYRESFADGYVTRLSARLEEMRDIAKDEVKSSGAEIALVDSFDRVKDAFWSEFPHLRPLTAEERAENLRLAREKREREAQEREEMLAAMTPAKRAAFFRKEEAERQREAKQNARWWREWERDQSMLYDDAGKRAGRDAADKIDLGRESKVSNSERRELS